MKQIIDKEVVNTIGFDNVIIEANLAGKIFEVSIDPPVEVYWKLVNATQKSEKTIEGMRKLKNYIIEFILDSHYSNKFWKLGKFFARQHLERNLGFLSLNNFMEQYFKILKERGILKNVQSPQNKK